MDNVLVFSIALNGYQWRYRALLNTHRAYAKKLGYRYISVTQPSFSLLGLEVAWLKIKLIIEALNAGYDKVIFLDADTLVSQSAPNMLSNLSKEKDIYAAKGFSGRYNSGVLLIQNSPSSKHFFESLLRMATRPIPSEDDVGWGENGHLIYLSQHYRPFGELETRWNNNQTASLDDYIRHYSRGPLHHEFTPPFLDHLRERLSHYALAAAKRLLKTFQPFLHKDDEDTFTSKLNSLSQKVCLRYPEFTQILP